MTTASKFFKALKDRFSKVADNEKAAAMSAYMRDQFSYYGIKAPERKALTKTVIKEIGFPDRKEWQTLGELCFAADAMRELQYVFGDLISPKAKKLGPDWLPFIEKLILTKSWWDTVDFLGPNMAGIILLNHPDQMEQWNERWLASDNIWLQRTVLIFQLRYKQNTRPQLLFDNVLALAHSDEFFIQKGAGWALRQYSKFEPASVENFIENHTLKPLTQREGMKIILKD